MRLAVHVTPRSSRDEVCGWRGDELLVKVRVAPESGKANDAVCLTIAAAVGLPKSTVRIVRGHTSRHKLVDIDADAERIATALGAPDAGLF